MRTGYEVVRVPMKDGHASGQYEDFLSGFVTPGGDVWGRPVGVAVAQDGALIVTDDGSNTVTVFCTGDLLPAWPNRITPPVDTVSPGFASTFSTTDTVCGLFVAFAAVTLTEP